MDKVVDIGPNLLAFLMAVVPTVVIVGAALAAYLKAQTDKIRNITQDTNDTVKRVEKQTNGTSNPPNKGA